MQPKPVKNLNGRICQICSDTVGVSSNDDIFVACNECAFPACRACYEYERKDGKQSCPQCKTRYKGHKGSPRVDGDDDEEDMIWRMSLFILGGKIKLDRNGMVMMVSCLHLRDVNLSTNPASYQRTAGLW